MILLVFGTAKYGFYFVWWLWINVPYLVYKYYWCLLFGNDCSELPLFKPLPIEDNENL